MLWMLARAHAVRPGGWPRRSDRGDVPGWVLITLMTAGIVAVLWGVAQGDLQSLFDDAVNSVKGPSGN
ncbi:MAG: hypothetical protein ACJ74O_02930 [Frankiaceae bacterium]